MRLAITFFIVLTIAATKARRDDYCDRCFHINDCHIMRRYNIQQQALWLMKYQCQDPYSIPGRVGDFVCCSKILREINYNMRLYNPITDFFEPNALQRNYFDEHGNHGFKHDTHPIYKPKTNQRYETRTVRPNQPSFNNNPLPRDLDVKNTVPSLGNEQNIEGMCLPSSFPPKPETECCGREATDAGRIIGSHNSPSINDAFPPQPNNQSPPSISQVGLSAGSRRRRDISEETVNITIGSRIAGGKATEFEQYPWTVLLKTTFDYGNRQESFNCGGSLISSKYVLTAAHCMHDANGTFSGVEVYLSEYDKKTFPIDCKNVLGVGEKCIENLIMYAEYVIIHSEYDSEGLINDIALIRLRGAAPYTDYIRPICILPINIDSPENSNMPLAVAGWGRNGPYRSDIKQSTVVNLVPQEQCKRDYMGLSAKHMCAVGHTGEDTCKGDSGGPLMTVYGGKHFVVGVVSGKRADYPCGTAVPSLYTNVYHYLDWIMKNIKN